MPAKGRPWQRTFTEFKAQCRKQNSPCWICNKPIDYSLVGRNPQAFSADHKTPTSHGGNNEPSNLKPSHYGCNARRGNVGRGDFPNSRRWA